VVFAFGVLEVEHRVVKPLERVFALLTGGDSAMECGAAAASVVGRLLPEFPLGSLGRIHLLQGEITPVHVEQIANLLFDISNQDRGAPGVGTTVVVIDIE
jgi:hypothetical protein